MDMVAAANSSTLPAPSEAHDAAPASPLLCDTCSCALIFQGAAAMLVGRCAPCVKRVALADRGIESPADLALTWGYLSRGNGCAHVEAVSFDGVEVLRGSYTYDRDGLEEYEGEIGRDAFDELRNELETGSRSHHGDVEHAFQRATALVKQLEADREQRAAREYHDDCMHDAEERAHAGECGEVSL